MSHNPRSLPVTLDGVSYAVEPGRLGVRYLPTRQQQVAFGEQPEALNPFGPKRFETTDWSLGAGQEFQDIEISSPRRFWESKNVNVFEDRGKIELSHDMEDIASSLDLSGNIDQSTLNRVFLLKEREHVYVIGRDTNGKARHYRSDDAFTANTPGWTQLTGGLDGSSNTIRHFSAGENHVYLADGNVIYRAGHSDTSFTSWSSENARFVFEARRSGRVLAELIDEDIGEVDSAGTFTSFGSVPDGYATQAAVEAPNGIYIGGFNDIPSPSRAVPMIFHVGINDDGTFADPVLAAQLPRYEAIWAMEILGGNVILIGQNRGLRLATINGDNTLTYGPIVELPGLEDIHEADQGVRDFSSDGRRHVFAWGRDTLDSGLSDQDPRAGQLVLEEFAEPLVPPYQNFIEISAGSNKPVAGVEKGFPWAGEPGERELVYVQEDTVYRTKLDTNSGVVHKASQGTLTSGWIRHRTLEKKIPRAVDVRTEPLPAGSSVKVYIIEEDDTETLAGTLDTTDATGPSAPFAVTTVSRAEKFRVKVELNRATDATEGPVVNSVALYALPVPTRTLEFTLPIRLFETVTDNNGVMQTFDVDSVISTLESLVEGRSVVTLELGNDSHQVTVENVEKVTGDADARWSDSGNALEGIWMVTCHSADLEAS